MRNIMKSTNRMLGGFKARNTRWLNNLRRKALDYHQKVDQEMGWYLTTIIPLPKDDWGHGDCCVELCIGAKDGYLPRWFKTWADAGDYLIDIAPHC